MSEHSDPFELYKTGAQRLWGAAFGDLPPAVLDPARSITAQDMLQTVANNAAPHPDISFSARNHLAHVALCSEWAGDREVMAETIDETHTRLADVLRDLRNQPKGNDTLAQLVTSTVFQMLLTRLRDPYHIAIPAVPTDGTTWTDAQGQRHSNMILHASASGGRWSSYAVRLRNNASRRNGQRWHDAGVYPLGLGYDLHKGMVMTPEAQPDDFGAGGTSNYTAQRYTIELTGRFLLDEASGGEITSGQRAYLDNRSNFYRDRIERDASASTDV